MPEFEERLERGLRELAEEFPPYAGVPSHLLRRARNGMAVSTLAIIVLVGVIGTAAAFGVRALAGLNREVPVTPPPPPRGNGLIAFVRTPTAGGPSTQWSDIYVMSPDGTEVRRVLGDSRSAYRGPAWSPDGTRIALVANPNNAFAGEGELAVVHADGTHLRLFAGVSAASRPAWSPDGGRIAFTNGQGAAIDVVNANGTGLRQIVPSPTARISTNVGEPTWSPDGRQIAFVAGPAEQGSIYVVNENGTGLRRLTTGGGDSFPAWSPSGSEVAFAREAGRGGGIYVVGPSGTHARRLVVCRLPGCVFAIAPAWSPDGSRIVFVESIDNGRSEQIFVLAVSSGRVRRLTSGPLDNVDPSWQPVPRSPSPEPSASSDTGPRITATIPVGPYPEAIAVGEGGAWVSVPAEHPSATNELVRVDPSTNRVVARIEVPAAPSSITTGYGAVWASAFEPRVGKVVFRIDPSTNRVVATIPGAGGYMAVGGGSVWSAGAANENGTKSVITRIDPKTDRIVARVLLDAPAPFLAFGEGALWAVSETGVLRIDPSTNRVIARIPLQAQADVLAVGDGWIWVWGLAPSAQSEGVLRIDPRTNRVGGPPIPLPNGFAPLGVDGIGVWFMTGGSVGGVARLNALTLQVDASVSLTQGPAFRVPPTAVLDPSRHTIWIANYRHSVTRIDTG